MRALRIKVFHLHKFEKSQIPPSGQIWENMGWIWLYYLLKANFFKCKFFHSPIFLPKLLLSSQGDERKSKCLVFNQRFGFRLSIFFSFIVLIHKEIRSWKNIALHSWKWVSGYQPFDLFFSIEIHVPVCIFQA